MADRRYSQYSDLGFEAYFVIAEDTNGSPPTASYCSQLKTQYQLPMPVLYDADGRLASAFSNAMVNDWNLVLGKGSKILLKGLASDSEIDAVIAAALE